MRRPPVEFGTPNPRKLDEIAAELWNDEHLRGLEPARAVDTWLTPIIVPQKPEH